VVDARASLTAADILRELQRQRPENIAIMPLGGIDESRTKLIPEGFMVVDRMGTLERRGDWWYFVPDSGEPGIMQIPPLRMLPSLALQPMAEMAEQGSAEARFEITGELTVFQKENYLLPRLVMHVTSPSSASASEKKREGTLPPASPSKLEPAATPKPAMEGSVDEVLAQLQAQAPPSRPMSMTVVAPASQPVDAVDKRPLASPEGAPIVDRPGRLIQQEGWSVFAFESDHPEHPEPPLRVLPNLNLEMMIEASRRGTNGLVFMVSGQVTTFGLENYVLIRSARNRLVASNLGR